MMTRAVVLRRISTHILSAAWIERLLVAGVLLGAELFAMAPLLKPGLPETADLMLHLVRAVELEPLLRSGWLVPRWAPDFAYGYGFPIFNYYAPLGAYLLALLHLLGLAFPVALKVAILGIFLAYGPSMYCFARRFLPSIPASVAAVAYVYVPFRFRELFVQADFAQFLAFAIVPLAFAGVYELARRPSPKSFAWTVLATAALVLSHNITAFTTAAFLGLYGLVLAATWGWRRLIPVGLAALSASLLTTFFWLPALAERNLVQLERLTAGYFDFSQYFVSPLALLSPSPVVDRAAANPPIPHNLGLSLVILSLLTLLTIPFWRTLARAERAHLVFGWLALLLAAFLMLPISTPVWEHVPFLDFVEFPWRFLALAGLATAILAGIAAHWILQRPALARWPLYPALILLIVVPSIVHLYPHEPFLAYDVNSTADIAPFEQQTGAIGTTSGGEYYPRWVSQPPGPSPQAGVLDPASLPAGATVHWIEREPLRQRYSLTLPAPAQLRFNIFYFPGWQLRLDGVPVALQPVTPAGLIGFDAPAGSHELDLAFGDTPLETASEIISAISLGLVLPGLFIWQRRRISRTHRQGAEPNDVVLTHESIPPYQVLSAVGVVLALFVLKPVVFDPWSLFSYASPPGQVRGVMVPSDATFGNHVRLLGYDLAPAVAAPGGEVRITLYWQALVPQEESFHSYVKLMRRSTGQVIAQTDHEHPGDIGIKGWRTDQYIRDEHVLRLPADTPAMAYQVMIGLYTMPGWKPLRVGSGNQAADALTLRPIVVGGSHVPPDRISHPLAWHSENGIALLGYRLEDSSAAPGDTIQIELFWRAVQAVPQDYTVFVHLLDPSGKLVAQADNMPLRGDYRTSEWAAGDEIEDPYRVNLPLDLAPGTYHFEIGLYDAGTGQRLELQGNGDQRSRQILLDSPVTIQPHPTVR